MIEDWITKEKSVIIDAYTGLEVPPEDILEKIGNNKYREFTIHAKSILNRAESIAVTDNLDRVDSLHILTAMSEENESIAAQALINLGIDLTKIEEMCNALRKR